MTLSKSREWVAGKVIQLARTPIVVAENIGKKSQTPQEDTCSASTYH